MAISFSCEFSGETPAAAGGPQAPEERLVGVVLLVAPGTLHNGVHRWRRLSWSERLTWSCWFVFQSKEDYGDPIIGARRREMLTVFFDTLLVLTAMIVWLVMSAALVEPGP